MPVSRPKEGMTPSRLKARRQKVRIRKLILLLVFLLFLFVSVVAVFYIPYIRVRDVSITGVESIDAGGVEQTVRHSLQGRKAIFFPNNNAFLYSERSIQTALMGAYPKIKEVHIQLSTFHSISVSITERTPKALWCGEIVNEESPCFYMDESGVVYEPAPDYSGGAYVRWYGKVIGEPLGGQYSKGSFASLLSFVEELDKEGLQSHDVELNTNGDVQVRYNGGFMILFSLEQKPEALLTALHAAENADVFKGKKLTDLAYLDLRFLGNRLYYKMK